MSESTSLSTDALRCPNCGASYALPADSNQVECAYCGSHFLVPEAVRKSTPTSTVPLEVGIATPVDVGRWVRWIVVFVVVVTVVPIICSLAATVCGVIAPLIAFFAK